MKKNKVRIFGIGLLSVTSLFLTTNLSINVNNEIQKVKKETRNESSSDSWGSGEITWSGTKATFNPLKAFGFDDNKSINSDNHKSSYYGHGSSFTTKFYSDDYTDSLWKNGSLGSIFGEDYSGRQTGVSSSSFNSQLGEDGLGYGDYAFSTYGSGFNLAIFSKYLNVNGVSEGSYNDIFILTLPNYVKSISDYSFEFKLIDQLVDNNTNGNNDMDIKDENTYTVVGSTTKDLSNAIEDGWGGYSSGTEYFRNYVDGNVLKLQTKYGMNGGEYDSQRNGDIIPFKSLKVTLTPEFYDIFIPSNDPVITSNSYSEDSSIVTFEYDENINWNGRNNTSSNAYDDYGMVAKVTNKTDTSVEQGVKFFVDTTSNTISVDGLAPDTEYEVSLWQYINPMNKSHGESDSLDQYELIPNTTYSFRTEKYLTSGSFVNVDITDVSPSTIDFSLSSSSVTNDPSTWLSNEWGTNSSITITLTDESTNTSIDYLISDFFNKESGTLNGNPSITGDENNLVYLGYETRPDDAVKSGYQFNFSLSNLESNHKYKIDALVDTNYITTEGVFAEPKLIIPDTFSTDYEIMQNEYEVENFTQVSSNEINFDIAIPEFDNRTFDDFASKIKLNGYSVNSTGDINTNTITNTLNDQTLIVQENSENNFNITLKGIENNTYIETIDINSKENRGIVDPEGISYEYNVNTSLKIDNSSMFVSPIMDKNKLYYSVNNSKDTILNIPFLDLGSFSSTYTDSDFSYKFSIEDLAQNIKFSVNDDNDVSDNKTLKELSDSGDAEYSFLESSNTLFIKISGNSSLWNSDGTTDGFDSVEQNLKIWLPKFINDEGDDKYVSTDDPLYKYLEIDMYEIDNLNDDDSVKINEDKTNLSYNSVTGIIDLEIWYSRLNINENNLFITFTEKNNGSETTQTKVLDINGYNEKYVNISTKENDGVDGSNESRINYQFSDELFPPECYIEIIDFGFSYANKTISRYDWNSSYYVQSKNVSSEGVYIDFETVDFESILDENISNFEVDVTSIKDNGFNFVLKIENEFKNEFSGDEIQIILGTSLYTLDDLKGEFSVKTSSNDGMTYYNYSISTLKSNKNYGNFSVNIATNYTKDGYVFNDNYRYDTGENIETLALFSNFTKILFIILIVLVILIFIIIITILIIKMKKQQREKLDEIEKFKNFEFEVEE